MRRLGANSQKHESVFGFGQLSANPNKLGDCRDWSRKITLVKSGNAYL